MAVPITSTGAVMVAPSAGAVMSTVGRIDVAGVDDEQRGRGQPGVARGVGGRSDDVVTSRRAGQNEARPLASSGTAWPSIVRPIEVTPTLSVAETMNVTSELTLTVVSGLTTRLTRGVWLSASTARSNDLGGEEPAVVGRR